MNKSTARDVVIAVTYRCNSRCRMCNIWQKTDHEGEFSPADLKFLPADLTDINLTGGEPFLRPDLPEMVSVIVARAPRAKIIISSNGFATELIIEQMKKIRAVKPDVGVAISLDGVGEKHSQIRGIEGGFEKALATLKALKALGVRNLKIGFTQGDYNLGELAKVYSLARTLGLEFTLALVHSSKNYFSKTNKITEQAAIARDFDWLAREELGSWNLKRWARAYFTHGLKTLLKTGQRILPDYSGESNLFIDPQGRIFPCDVESEEIGQLRGWGLKRPAAPVGHAPSWMICTARPAMKKHWLRVGWWVISTKLRILSRIYE